MSGSVRLQPQDMVRSAAFDLLLTQKDALATFAATKPTCAGLQHPWRFALKHAESCATCAPWFASLRSAVVPFVGDRHLDLALNLVDQVARGQQPLSHVVSFRAVPAQCVPVRTDAGGVILEMRVAHDAFLAEAIDALRDAWPEVQENQQDPRYPGDRRAGPTRPARDLLWRLWHERDGAGAEKIADSWADLTDPRSAGPARGHETYPAWREWQSAGAALETLDARYVRTRLLYASKRLDLAG